MLLLAQVYLEMNTLISFTFWSLGAVLQAILTLVILSKLIWTFSFKMEQFNPAWFIPIVGNIIVPLAGLSHVDTDLNWMFFSTGIVFSIVYTTIFINRIFFIHHYLKNYYLHFYFNGSARDWFCIVY